MPDPPAAEGAGAIATGSEVGHYRVLGPLAAGGMGAIHVVEHVHLQRRFAMKVLLPGLCRDADQIRRFETEARTVARIGHEHVVDAIDFGRTPSGEFYYVME